MGFHLRKTKKFGLFNFNLSNSGIGTSFGIKGFRIGIDGKGRAYVGGGKGILRYRQYLKNNNNKEDKNLYSEINNYLPYMMKNNSLVFLCKFLFWLIAPILLFGSTLILFKEPFISFIIIGIIYLLTIQIFFSKKAKARKECQQAMKEILNNNIEHAVEHFNNALIYKNSYYQEKIKNIIDMLSNKK